MKRNAFIFAFVLAAALVSSEPKPFVFDAGAGLGYLAYSHDEQSELSGDLADIQGTYGFWGANVFADISEYVTVYSGIWMGLGSVHVTGEGVVPSIDTTYANSLFELEVGAVLKYPIHVGPSFTFSPKIGLSDMFYLSGQAGTSAPDAKSTYATSPFSVVTGFDADYLFPNGVFLRLPLDFGWGLNSRPSSETGTYVSSNSVSFRTGISVGYRLSGMSTDNAPPPPPSPATAAAPAPADAPKPKDAAPAKPFKFAVGGGTTGTLMVISQSQTEPVVGTLRTDEIYGNAGLYGFADITDYFSVFLGIERGVGSVAGDVNDIPLSGGTSALLYFDFGAEVKYPVIVNPTFSVAPKVGIAESMTFGGTISGNTVSGADEKQLLSPLSVTAGADLNFEQANNLFFRVPLDVGWALNTKLSNSYYAGLGGTYKSSYTLVFHSGVVIGYRL